jgi:predicted heme/steroid binding protein/uncharacterized membrane protein
LNAVGRAFIVNGYRVPIPNALLSQMPSGRSLIDRVLSLVVGYLHLLAAIIFGGTIFYVHIFIRPTRLTGGIPRGERVLGLSCMAVLTITGTHLTLHRIHDIDQFFTSTFGIMLFIKILLFVVMVTLGLTAVTVIHRRIRKAAASPEEPADASEVTYDTLHRFDGSDDKPAYVVYDGMIYDVTDSPKWKDGRHFGRHAAGSDLTEALTGAPHGAEVFDTLMCHGAISAGATNAPMFTRTRRVFVAMAYANLIIVFLILACVSIWKWGFPVRLVGRQSPAAAVSNRTACLKCHETLHPGIFNDWQRSAHATSGVGCADCHEAEENGNLFSRAHLDKHPTPVAIVVSPRICERCHASQAAEYNRSKHAHTYEIIWKIDYWLNHGMNNAVERTTGCYACHGTVVKVVAGKPLPGTWPNVGVGRVNPDGSLGSCSSCHTRHRFSVEEARKPEACDQCHLGPDHPQIEIYNESKHGTIYHAEGDTWRWDREDGQWLAGRDFRTPTCAACHLSATADIAATHDATERLSWELQAPLTVRPSEFAPFPAVTQWDEERAKMRTVCTQCHSTTWVDDHFANLDAVVENYNVQYFGPAKRLLDGLYSEGGLTQDVYFDEDFEWEFYELWHHEGRRARMGSAMMAPDYAWWHGFYELKSRLNHLYMEFDRLQRLGKDSVHTRFPGRSHR